MSSTQEPLISLTSVPPSGSGVAPLIAPSSVGGLCRHTPVVPYCRTTRCAWLMKRTRQLYASATVTSPFGRRYASSGVCRYPFADRRWCRIVLGAMRREPDPGDRGEGEDDEPRCAPPPPARELLLAAPALTRWHPANLGVET